jgi:hypothetical protein
VCSEKQFGIKNNPAACGPGTEFIFMKNAKKAEKKRCLSRCGRIKFCFHEKQSMPGC